MSDQSYLYSSSGHGAPGQEASRDVSTWPSSSSQDREVVSAAAVRDAAAAQAPAAQPSVPSRESGARTGAATQEGMNGGVMGARYQPDYAAAQGRAPSRTQSMFDRTPQQYDIATPAGGSPMSLDDSGVRTGARSRQMRRPPVGSARIGVRRRAIEDAVSPSLRARGEDGAAIPQARSADGAPHGAHSNSGSSASGHRAGESPASLRARLRESELIAKRNADQARRAQLLGEAQVRKVLESESAVQKIALETHERELHLRAEEEQVKYRAARLNQEMENVAGYATWEAQEKTERAEASLRFAHAEAQKASVQSAEAQRTSRQIQLRAEQSLQIAHAEAAKASIQSAEAQRDARQTQLQAEQSTARIEQEANQ